jgi:hypothetical protein
MRPPRLPDNWIGELFYTSPLASLARAQKRIKMIESSRYSEFLSYKCQPLQPTLFRIRNVMMRFDGSDFAVELAVGRLRHTDCL